MYSSSMCGELDIEIERRVTRDVGDSIGGKETFVYLPMRSTIKTMAKVKRLELVELFF